MTTIRTEKRTEPLEDAIKRARIRVLAKPYHRGMTTAELKQRQKDLRHYENLRRIDEMTSRDYRTATVDYFG